MTFIVGTIVLAGAVAFGGWWIAGQLRADPIVEHVSPTPLPSTFYLATQQPMSNERSDDGGRDFSYSVTSVDGQSFDETEIGTFQSSIFSQTFQLSDGKVYFVNDEGELSTYSLTNAQVERVAIPGIEAVFGFFNESSIHDFVIDDSSHSIVYLQGLCTNGQSCSLKRFDLTTKKVTIISSGLEKSLLLSGKTTLSLKGITTEEDSSIILIRTQGKSGIVDLIGVSAVTGKSTVIRSVPKGLEADILLAKGIECHEAFGDQEVMVDSISGLPEARTTITNPAGQQMVWKPTYLLGCITQ